MAIGRQITLTPNIASKVISATATASQKQFTVTGGYRVDELAVYRNGIRLVNGQDYTATDGSIVTLIEGASLSDIFEFQIFDSFNIADAIDSSSGNQTIAGNLTVSGTLTATTATTSSGPLTISNSTASTSSSTGALIVTGGVGIGKSLFVSEGISVGGTITYDDVTNIDSVGIVTAGKGFRATTGGIIVTAGVSTFTEDVKIGTAATTAVFDISTGQLGIGTINPSNFTGGAANLVVGTGVGWEGMTIYAGTGHGGNIYFADGFSGADLYDGWLQFNHSSSRFTFGFRDNSKVWINSNGDINASGVCTATSFSGDGSELSGVVSGIEVKSSGTSVGTSLTALNFTGATITTGSAGITTITIAAAGLSTSAYAVPTAGLTTYLKLSDAQDHKLTASGITTVTCYGGTEGDSHTLRIVNSGVSTVGFSTYFLWPSGASPSLTSSDGAINLVSFTVQRVGTAGTQLLAGASLNFSY